MTLHEVHIDATLAELAGVTDDAVGRDTGMAELLRQWVRAKDIERHLERGSAWLRSREYSDRLGGDMDPPRERTPIPDDYYGTDEVEPTSVSGIVKKYDPVGWDAARDVKVYARLGGPRTRALPADIEVDRRARTKPVTLRRRLAALRSLNRAELKSLRDELVALMDEAGWDESTRLTSDGYRIGRDTHGKFNARRYYELVPEDRRPVQLRVLTDAVVDL
jgi:hypothetical protein